MSNEIDVGADSSAIEREKQQNQLLTKVKEKGGHAGNVTLQRELDWDVNLYWQIRDRLVDLGKLELGKGKGGSVSLVVQTETITTAETSEGTPTSVSSKIPENTLYEPVAKVLREEWSHDKRFRNSIVEVTAKQGRRDTGGTWTRPDIVVAALRVFAHVPNKFFDLITFELKPLDGIDVSGVFEALAHRRAATQAYLWLHVPNASDYDTDKLARIGEEARRYGVGLIVGSDAADYSSWDRQIEAIRVDPDPELLNTFIAQQLSSIAKDKLAEWFR